MSLAEAIEFLRSAFTLNPGVWADVGAGSGIFTQALDQVLPLPSHILAFDQYTQDLDRIQLHRVTMESVEADYHNPPPLPELQGILMANSLHYSTTQEDVLKHWVSHLAPDGQVLFIEYDTLTPRPPWVPYPISFARFRKMAPAVGLQTPTLVNTRRSRYGQQALYLAVAQKATSEASALDSHKPEGLPE